MKSKKILFIVTSQDKMGDTDADSGVWLEELAAPYYIFKEAGAEIILASPKGGAIPLEPKSQSIIVVTFKGKTFLKDPDAMSFISNSIMLEEVNPDNFDMVFLPGGHGAMWDLADNIILKQLLEAFNNSNKLIGLLSHSVVGLLSLLNENGELLIKGKQLTGFSNSEEESARLIDILPFLLETKLVSLGALYTKGESYTSHVVTDGNIVTGQNPSSAVDLAKKLIELTKEGKYSQPMITAI